MGRNKIYKKLCLRAIESQNYQALENEAAV